MNLRHLIVLTTAFTAAGLGVSATAGAQPAPAGSHVAAASSASAPATTRAQLSGARGTVHYAVPKRMCGTPSLTTKTCMGIRLVRVPKGTHGAKAYVSPAYSVGPAGGYTPADLATAYGINPASSTGGSQTVAIVDAYNDPHALTELNAFDAHYGLPSETATSFRKVNQFGNATPLPTNDAGWAGEIALDLQAVRAVCNHCKILLVEGNSASNADLATAVNTAARMHATEISNSYGGPENPNAPSSLAAAYDHPGIVVTASTGDHGWYDWDFANDAPNGESDNAPNTPAAYPTVVAVGGTALQLNSDGSRAQEQVWNENGPDDDVGLMAFIGWNGDQGASGGGCSFVYQAPSWQAGVAGYGNTGCGTNRLAGDVAADADPFTGFDVNIAGSWTTIGGTSLASPLIAGMWALAGGAGGVSYPGRSLYDHFHWTPSSLYDVQIGGNAFCDGDTAANCSAVLESETTPPTGNPNNLLNGNTVYTNGWAGLLDCGYNYDGTEGTIAANTQCNATTGYDGPSGVGTPNGVNAFTAMIPKISLRGPALIKRNVSANFSAVNFSDPIPGSSPVSYHWSWGDGSSPTVTTVPSASHTFGTKGTYTVKLTVVDNNGRSSVAAARKYTLGYAPSVSISGLTSVRVNTSHTWSAKASDKNTGGKIVKWSWKIGSTVVGSKASLTHKFTRTGKFSLSVTVTDNSGLRTTKTITVTVTR
jgi:subtilase family serine protease